MVRMHIAFVLAQYRKIYWILNTAGGRAIRSEYRKYWKKKIEWERESESVKRPYTKWHSCWCEYHEYHIELFCYASNIVWNWKMGGREREEEREWKKELKRCKAYWKHKRSITWHNSYHTVIQFEREWKILVIFLGTYYLSNQSFRIGNSARKRKEKKDSQATTEAVDILMFLWIRREKKASPGEKQPHVYGRNVLLNCVHYTNAYT